MNTIMIPVVVYYKNLLIHFIGQQCSGSVGRVT